VGEPVLRMAQRAEDTVKGLFVPGMLFEELGFEYVGPIDGHKIEMLVETFDRFKDFPGPVLIHAITKKGKGYAPAEKSPWIFHGVGPFDIETGNQISSKDISAIGITNQRETTVLWDKITGKPIYNAIVWQDRRTSDKCQNLRDHGHENIVTKKTGLLLDPYFCATKIAWILDNVEGAREKASADKLAFGTIDSFLLWRLSDKKIHSTDATNASRTLLYNIHEGCWDKDLLELFNIPKSMLPLVCDSAANFGNAARAGDPESE